MGMNTRLESGSMGMETIIALILLSKKMNKKTVGSFDTTIKGVA